MPATTSGQGPRPEPVADAGWTAAAATILVGAVVHVLASWGLLVPESVSDAAAEFVQVSIVAVVGALSSLASSYWARRRVTPLASPRDADGRPLLSQVPDDGPQHDDDGANRPYVDIERLRREYNL